MSFTKIRQLLVASIAVMGLVVSSVGTVHAATGEAFKHVGIDSMTSSGQLYSMGAGSVILVQSGSSVTVTAKKYTPTTDPNAVDEYVTESIGADTQVAWKYCSDNCMSSGGHIGDGTAVMSDLAVTNGGTITLKNVTGPVFIQPRIAGTEWGYAPYQNIVPFANASAVKLALVAASISDTSAAPGTYQAFASLSDSTNLRPSANYVGLMGEDDGTIEVFAADGAGLPTGTAISPVTYTNSYGFESTYIPVQEGQKYVAVYTPAVGTGSGGAITSTALTVDSANLLTNPAQPTMAGPLSAPAYEVPTDSSQDGGSSSTPADSNSTSGSASTTGPTVSLVGATGGETITNTAIVSLAGVTSPTGITLSYAVKFDVVSVASGGTITVKLALDKEYANLSQVRLYKGTATGGNLTDITSKVTLSNENGKTYVSYQLTDGGTMDEDGVANGSIADPIFVGVVNGTSTSLADTGTATVAASAAALTIIAVGAVVFTRRSKRAVTYHL